MNNEETELRLEQLESDIFTLRIDADESVVEHGGTDVPLTPAVDADTGNHFFHHNQLMGLSEADDHGGLYRMDGLPAEDIYYPLALIGMGNADDNNSISDSFRRNSWYNIRKGVGNTKMNPTCFGYEIYVEDSIRVKKLQIMEQWSDSTLNDVNYWDTDNLYIDVDSEIYAKAASDIYFGTPNDIYLVSGSYSTFGSLKLDSDDVTLSGKAFVGEGDTYLKTDGNKTLLRAGKSYIDMEVGGDSFIYFAFDLDIDVNDYLDISAGSDIDLKPTGALLINGTPGKSGTFKAYDNSGNVVTVTTTKGLVTGIS